MTKQAMAKLLIERGCELAFNTLRKYSKERLEAMLASQHVDTQLQAVNTVPTDRELYIKAISNCERTPATLPVVDPGW